MKLILISLTLRNFKGQRDITIPFSGGITTISGRNGSGKSTIADGIFYCLFGKDSQGNTQFGIKTRDANGNIIPHLEHEATLNILVDDVPHTLSRIMRDKYHKDNLIGNTIEYFLDGDKVTKTEYDKFICTIAPEDSFRFLTHPFYFTSLHWNEQRNRLLQLAGDVTQQEITNNEPRFSQLVEELKAKSLTQYLKHLRYQISELRKKIDEMPVRLSTMQKTLPEKLAWDELQRQYDALLITQNEVQSKINNIKQGYADDVQKSAIRQKIQFFEKRIDDIRQSKRNLAREEESRHDTDLLNARTALVDAEELQRTLSLKRNSIDTCIDKCNEAIKEYKSKKNVGADEWSFMMQQKFSYDESKTICPTCGQPLPEDQVAEAVRKAHEEFQLSQANHKKELLARLDDIKRGIEQSESEKDEYIKEMSRIDEQAKKVAMSVIEKKQFLKELEANRPLTVQQILDNDKNYNQVVAELQKMKQQLATESVTTDSGSLLANLTSQLNEINSQLSALNTQLLTKPQYERIEKMISDTNDEWQSLNAQLTKYEQQQDIAYEYSRREDALVEQRVNSLFHLTRFNLFKTFADGTKEPFCTATHDGVEYKDVNRAMQIAIGIDIINTFSRHYNLCLPIVLDNSECLNTIPESPSQKISLSVSNSQDLTVQ